MSKVLVYGGKGALGSTVCKAFREKNWTVFSADCVAQEDANHSVLIDFKQELKQQFTQAKESIESALGGEKFDAIINVAGGWAGGNVSDDSIFDTTELMWKQSGYSSIISARLASIYLKDNGLLVLTGASSAMGATSFCVGYGMAKAAVHQLVSSLAQSDGGLPAQAKAIAVAPVMLDTPGNRAGMPKADTSSWTPLAEVASKLFQWANKEEEVDNGKVYKVITSSGKTVYE